MVEKKQKKRKIEENRGKQTKVEIMKKNMKTMGNFKDMMMP